MKASILFIVSISIFSLTSAQTERFETEWFLYWQMNTKLTFDDFQKIADSTDLAMLDEYGVGSLANVQIHCILDYPKKARKIKTLKEQWYFAPVFCKKCSPISRQDSSDLLEAQIYFDIAEYCTRMTRQKITELEKKNFGNGFIAALFPRLVDDMYNLMGEMFGAYGRDILIDKVPHAYEDWRVKIDKLLNSTIDFATEPIDCSRFINEKPYSDDYRVSYEIYGKSL